MLIAARNGMMAGGWKNPYVTDGLVAMWDAEWNAGGGVHDPNATVWKDLSGNGNDLSVVGDAVGWNTNYYNFTRNEYFNGLIESVFTANSSFTIETVLVMKRGTGAALGTEYTVNYWIKFESFNGICGWGIGNLAMPSNIGLTFDTLGSVGISRQSSSWAQYLNGVKKNSSFTTTASFGTVFNIGRASVNEQKTLFQSFITRIYNRAISVDEVAANYAVDKARFNLP